MKDVLPALLLSNVVYKFSCHCDSRYAHFNDNRTEFVNTCQNLSEPAEFQTLATPPLVLKNLQHQHV